MPDAASLTIVLPAWNEAERIGGSLDELFGYLRRHGAQAHEGGAGCRRAPGTGRRLVVDDGSTGSDRFIAPAAGAAVG